MSVINGQFIRPLLFTKKSCIIEYAHQNGIDYREDETNGDTAYSRNNIRKLLEGMTGFANGCSRFALLAAADEQYLEDCANAELLKMRTGTGIEFSALQNLHFAVGSRIIRQHAADCGLRADLENIHVRNILALSGTGKSTDLPHGFTARLSYGNLIIERRGDTMTGNDWERELTHGENITPLGKLVVRNVPQSEIIPGDMFCVYSDSVRGTLRFRRQGDFMALPGGRKKLKDVYIDKKADRELRKLPVLAMGSEVLWAVGVAVSAKLSAQGASVELKFFR